MLMKVRIKKKFDVVLLDPPWSYSGQQDKWGAAAKFYKTMTDQEIYELPIGDFLCEQGVVFVWATCPRLDAAMDAIGSWGLFYRGIAFVWVKTRKDGQPIGAQGVRPSIVKPTCELVLAASNVRHGRPMSLADESVRQVVMAPKGRHSEKPDEVQERIELMYPGSRKLEMFARRRRQGWECRGDQLPGSF